MDREINKNSNSDRSATVTDRSVLSDILVSEETLEPTTLVSDQRGSVPGYSQTNPNTVIDATSDFTRDIGGTGVQSPVEATPASVYSNKGARFADKRTRGKVVAIIVVILLLMLIVGGALFFVFTKKGEDPTNANRNKVVTNLSNEDLLKVTNDGGFASASRVTVNGPLEVNNRLVVNPSARPDNAEAGQLYFDQNTRQFTYYDGENFHTLVSNLLFDRLSEFSRANAGAGLVLAGGTLNNSGVLSLQGQTGDVTFNSGAGIGVNGTTIANTGVLSLQGSTGDVSLTAGSGIALNGLTVTNTGVTALSGTNGQVNVSASSGSIVLSLPQSIAPTAAPTFGGLTLGSALGVGSGGTGNSNYNNNGVIYYDGTRFVSTPTPSAGLCLISNGSGTPVFGSCTGGTTVTSLNSLSGGINLIAGVGVAVTAVGNNLEIAAPAAAGVTSLNGANGALTVANSTIAGTVITINDASTSAKGLAQFNASDFGVTGGVVSLDSSITKRGNTFNGANQLVLLDSSGFLPALNGAALTNLNANNIATGTLSVARGGTGASSFTLNGVLYGNGTSGIQSTAAGTTGQCLVVNGSGVPVFGTCTGAGGVSSVNTKNGAVTIQGGTAIAVDNTGANIVLNNTGVTQLIGATDQVSVSSATGSITLSLPQAIGLTSNVVFNQMTLGQNGSSAGRLVLNGSTSNSVSLVAPASPSSGLTFTLPSADGVANQCLQTNGAGQLSFGTCLGGGSGGGISGSGTANQLAKFTNGQTIGNSNISDDGTTVTISSGAAIQGSAGLFVGTSSVAGNISLSDGSSNSTSLRAASTSSNLTFVLPNSTGANGQCIKTDGSGNLSFGNCLGGGSGGGVDSITGSAGGSVAASGPITINDASTSGSAITINTASNSVRGIASFSSNSFDVTAGVVTIKNDGVVLGTQTTGNYVASVVAGNGIQGGASGEGSTPTIALGPLTSDWNQSGAFDIVLANANAGIKIMGNSGTFYGSIDVGSLTADRTYTFPDSSGTVCLTSGNCIGSGGGVSSTGTDGYIAMFDGGSYVIADSIMSQSGGTINVSGALTATSFQGNGSAITGLNAGNISTGTLAAARGGTGVDASAAANGQLLIGNGAGFSLATLTAGTGIVVANTAGGITISAPDSGTCSGCADADDVVNSILGTTGGSAAIKGVLTINDALTSGSAITINTATNSVKGIASFSSAYFDVVSGAVSIKDDSIALGTKTTGNYVAGVTGGNGLTVTGSGAEGASVAVNLNIQANKGLVADPSGLGLVSCTTNQILKYNAGGQWICATDSAGGDGVNTIGALDSQTKSANGAVISGNTLTLQTADATNAGLVGTSAQTFAGDKTFVGATTFRNATDSTAAFRIQSLAGDNLLNADTINKTLTVADLRPETVGSVVAGGKTTVDSTGNVGAGSSVAIGPDGFARIAYLDVTNSDLKFAQCLDANCSTSVINTIDSTGNVGAGSSVAIAPDGFARIAYFDTTNSRMKYIQCTNASCSTNIVTTPVGSSTGRFNQIVIGNDGFSRILTMSSSADTLRYVQCTNASCSTSVDTVITPATLSRSLGLAIGPDGFARIAYGNDDTSTFRFVQCTNDSCSTNVPTAIGSGTIGAMAIGPDGFARIVHGSSFERCTNTSCSTKVTTAITPSISDAISMRIGTDGFARILTRASTGNSLNLITCTNADCSTRSNRVIEADTGSLERAALAVGVDNSAHISYYDAVNGDLKFALPSSISGTAIGGSTTPFGMIYATGLQVQGFSIDADNATSLTGSLTVAGATSLNGGLTVTGAATVNGTLAVTTLGAADSTTLLCRNSLNQVATCNSIPGVTTIGTLDSQTKSVNGAVINGNNLILQTADENFAGLVSTGNQNFAGNKTFTGATTVKTSSNTAMQIQNSSGDVLFNANTTNQTIVVGDSTGNGSRLHVKGAASQWTARTAAEANSWNSVTYGNGLFVAVSGDGTNRVMTSPDGITWTARTAPNSYWYSVTYGNGMFVAVANSGTDRVMTSPDGITWTARTAAQANNWRSVTYGNGIFVAVSSTGTNRVMTSPDGITWTARTAASSTESVTYGNGLFVAVGSSGAVITSPDGITWTTRTAAEANSWVSVVYGSGQFVAVSYTGTNRVMTSPDGITWTARSAAQQNNWYSITYGNGMFVSTSTNGTNRVMTSPDGVTWSAQTAAEANSWQSVTYGNGLLVAVSYTGTNRVMTSTGLYGKAFTADGAIESNGGIDSRGDIRVTGNTSISNNLTVAGATDLNSLNVNGQATFNNTATFKTTSSNALRIQNANNEFLFRADTSNQRITVGNGFGSDAKLHVSSELSVWTARTAAQANTWQSITYGNGTFVAVSDTGTNRVMTSPDGITWTARTAAQANAWQAVTYGNGTFVAVAGNGTNRVMTSPDGITWTARSAAEANNWLSVTYGNGTFVAVSEAGTNRVMTSPDGITWTARSAAEANTWQSVTYGNNLFVAIARFGSTNRVMTSPDGITWTARSAPQSSNQWRTVTYGKGIFVAVSAGYGETNQVITSPDGITWTARNQSHENRWVSLAYGNGQFIALATEGAASSRIMVSSDGINWAGQAASEANSWSSLVYGNGIFAAVSSDGTNRVMTSPGGYQTAIRSDGSIEAYGSIVASGDIQGGTINAINSLQVGGVSRITSTGVLQNVSIAPGGSVKVGTTGGILYTDASGTIQSLSLVGQENNCVGLSALGVVQFQGCSGSGGGLTNFTNGGSGFTNGNGTTATVRLTGNSYNSTITNPVLGLTSNADLDILTNNVSRIRITSGGNVQILSGTANSTEQFVVRNLSTGSPASTVYTLRVDTSSDTFGRVGIGLLTGNAPQVRLDIGGNATSTGSTANGGIQVWASAAPGLSQGGSTGAGSVISGRIYFDETTGKFRVSENGGAWVNLIQTAGSAPVLIGGNNGQNGSGGGGILTIGNTNANSSNTGTYGLLLGTANNNNAISSGFKIDYNGNYLFDRPYTDNDQYGFKIAGNGTGANGALHVDTRYNVVAVGDISTNSTASYGKFIVEGGAMITGGIRVGTGSEDIGLTLACASSQQTVDSPQFKNGILVKHNGCRANNSDLAEAYNNHDGAQPGELVMISATSATTMERATSANNSRLSGIISTAPSQTLGTAQVPDGKPVALVGRVPTKVNTEGGAINVGDKITISSVAGIGKKATGRGMVVGTAMEAFNGSGTGSIEVYVNTSYYDPTDGANFQADAALFGDLNVSGMTTLKNLTVTGDAVFQGNITVNGHIISGGNAPTVQNPQTGVTLDVDGTDTTGTVTVTVTTPTTVGNIGTVTFDKAFEKAPRVSLTPDNAAASAVKYYTSGRTVNGFDIAINETIAPGVYTFNYQVIQ